MKTRILLSTVAAVSMMAVLPSAKADTTVHTHTKVQTQDLENVNQIRFSAFDLNKDGVYSKEEVGEKLFQVFDQDGNHVIDNIEWTKRSVYTIMPMEKTTYKFVDYNHDGIAEEATYTYEEFYAASGLIRFDKDKNGLSPREFIGEGFEVLDDSENKMIELEEWKEAYIESLSPENAQQDNYN
jgi:Ca2+-binding EF-hand superfamily protein